MRSRDVYGTGSWRTLTLWDANGPTGRLCDVVTSLKTPPSSTTPTSANPTSTALEAAPPPRLLKVPLSSLQPALALKFLQRLLLRSLRARLLLRFLRSPPLPKHPLNDSTYSSGGYLFNRARFDAWHDLLSFVNLPSFVYTGHITWLLPLASNNNHSFNVSVGLFSRESG